VPPLLPAQRQKQGLRIGVHWSPSFVRGSLSYRFRLPPRSGPGLEGDTGGDTGFRSALVSGPDLEKAKKTAVARHIFGKESVSAMASSLASSYMMSGDPYFDEEYNLGVRAVTAEEVRSAAQRYLVPERMSVAVIKPSSPEQKAGQTAAAPTCPLPQTTPVEFGRMASGLKTLVKQDASLPFVTMHIYGTGGLVLEDFDRQGISAFTARCLPRGPGLAQESWRNRSGPVESWPTSDNNNYHVSIKG